MRSATVSPRLVLALLASAASAAILTGCAGFSTQSASEPVAGVVLSGHVHGGQQPVTGAHVYLYAAGTSGYGSASSSLLTTGSPGVSTDANSHGYVTTDANGNFTITGDYSCSNGIAQTYLLAVGGNPGLTTGTSNSAITLIAALGTCSGLTSSTITDISEVSTAAAVTALQQFMVDPTHIGSSSTNSAGIANAFISIQNIVNGATGTSRTTNLAGTGTVPQSLINTLGDILSPCVNSAAPSSSPCSRLFTAATPSGSTTPSDVASAMLLIAKYPSYNPSGLYGLIDSNAPFRPNLSSAPNDFTVGITYTGGGLTAPGDVVIDASGNAWATNCPSCNSTVGVDSIVGFGPQGTILSGPTGYTASIHKPQGLAVDNSGNLWSTDLASGAQPDQVVRLSSSGTLSAGFPFSDSTISMPLGVAIDSSSNAWVTNQGLNNAVKISTSGTRLVGPVTSPGFVAPTGIGVDGIGVIFAAGTGSSSILKFDTNGNILSGSGSGYTGAGLAQPIGIAIDNSDDIWTFNNQSNSISEINGTNGAAVSPAPGYYAGLAQASIISIDGLGSAWIANCRVSCGTGGTAPDDIVHVLPGGTVAPGASGYENASFSTVGATAIDASGNLWVTNNTGGSITELLGVAGPVRTPFAAASSNQLGSRP